MLSLSTPDHVLKSNTTQVPTLNKKKPRMSINWYLLNFYHTMNNHDVIDQYLLIVFKHFNDQIQHQILCKRLKI